MRALLPVAEALARILAAGAAHPRDVELIAVQEAAGRVLAADLAARRTQPPHDVSSMDGFALHAADTDPPGKALKIIGESAAGHPFAGTVRAGEAIRIFTGAIVPEGADAVLLQERADVTGDHVASQIALAPDTSIRRAGRDFRRGEVLLTAGTRLTPGAIALAGAMNHATLPVFRRPRIAILATGDELVAPGAAGAEEAIVATNAFAIAAMCRAVGAEVMGWMRLVSPTMGCQKAVAAGSATTCNSTSGWVLMAFANSTTYLTMPPRCPPAGTCAAMSSQEIVIPATCPSTRSARAVGGGMPTNRSVPAPPEQGRVGPASSTGTEAPRTAR